MTATSVVRAADVDDHVARRLSDGESRADRSGHRLFDQIRLPRACAQRRLFDRALLDAVTPEGTHTYGRADVRAVLMHLLDEVTQHLLGDVESPR